MSKSHWICRCYIKQHPDTIFVYGDDLTQVACKGQAQECDGEPNAFFVPTRIWCCDIMDAQFKDCNLELRHKAEIDWCMDRILKEALNSHITHYHILPKIGRGCSKMHLLAPKCYAYLLSQLQRLNPTYKG